MKINKLIDSFEDESALLYQQQKDRLLEGILLDYSFIRINPFKGISRKNNFVNLPDDKVDTGLYSFIFKSDLFSIVNPDARVVYFDKIALFSDEFYEIKLISGTYQTKSVSLKINDLIDANLFEDDQLISNLLKYKNIKVLIKLREVGEFRKIVEKKISIENTDKHAEDILENFITKIADRQIEKSSSTVYQYLDLLKVSYDKNDNRDNLVEKFKKLNIRDLHIKKDLLYLGLLLNAASSTSPSKEEWANIIDNVNNKYEALKKQMKVLDYKLRAKYITIKDNTSI